MVCSSTVAVVRSASNWSSMPIRAPRSRVTLPVAGASSPLISRSMVDLPAPLGPTTPSRCPGCRLKVRSLKTVVAPYSALTPSKLRRGMVLQLYGEGAWRRRGGRFTQVVNRVLDNFCTRYGGFECLCTQDIDFQRTQG